MYGTALRSAAKEHDIGVCKSDRGDGHWTRCLGAGVCTGVWNYGKRVLCASVPGRGAAQCDSGHYSADCSDSGYYYDVKESEGYGVGYERSFEGAFCAVSENAGDGCGEVVISE